MAGKAPKRGQKRNPFIEGMAAFTGKNSAWIKDDLNTDPGLVWRARKRNIEEDREETLRQIRSKKAGREFAAAEKKKRSRPKQASAFTAGSPADRGSRRRYG